MFDIKFFINLAEGSSKLPCMMLVSKSKNLAVGDQRYFLLHRLEKKNTCKPTVSKWDAKDAALLENASVNSRQNFPFLLATFSLLAIQEFQK